MKLWKWMTATLAVLVMCISVCPAACAEELHEPVDAPSLMADDTEIWDGTVADSFAGGSGTEEDPYQIANGSQLARLNEVDTTGLYFIQTVDIRLNDTSNWKKWFLQRPANDWTPIENFKGHYDGQDYTVFGVHVNSNFDVGLFTSVPKGSVLQNVHVAESRIHTFGSIAGCTLYAGGVAGQNDGTLVNCSSTCNIFGAAYTAYVGGVVGCNRGTMVNCTNNSSVSVSDGQQGNQTFVLHVGGVAGYNAGTIAECVNTGSIDGSVHSANPSCRIYAGGVAGYHAKTLERCSNSGAINVRGEGADPVFQSYVGGITGYNTSSVTQCSNSGAVTSSGTTVYAAGTAGKNTGTVSDCLNEGIITVSASDLFAGGIVAYNDKAVYNCCNSGIINCMTDTDYKTIYSAGIVGCNNKAKKTTVTNCFNCGKVTEKRPGNNQIYISYAVVGSGPSTDCYFLGDYAQISNELLMTEARLTAGFAAYLLGEVWGQNIDNGQPNEGHPVLGGARVYLNEDDVFTNDPNFITPGTNTDSSKIWSGVSAIGFGGGTGTKEDPWQINNGSQLAHLREINTSGRYFVLTADIHLNDVSCFDDWTYSAEKNNWKPIQTFKGHFDGQGHTISGLLVKNGGSSGLFGTVEKGGEVRNIRIVESLIQIISDSSAQHIGAVAGKNYGTLENCFNSSSISICTANSNLYIGGLIGQNYGTVTNCFNEGNIIETPSNSKYTIYIGGIVGRHNTGTVQNCVNTGDINSNGGYLVGGIAGYTAAAMKRCFNIGDMYPVHQTVVGNSSDDCSITECYYLSERSTSDGTLGSILPILPDTSPPSFIKPVTAELLNSGWATHLLGKLWGQNLDNDLPNEGHPVLGGARVYINEDGTYSNDLGFVGGTGTEEDPYMVSDIRQLGRLNQIDTAGVHFIQVADICLNDTADWQNWQTDAPALHWTPIDLFEGQFDGQGFTISGLYVDADSDAGLFVSVSEGSVIRNVHIADSYIHGRCSSGELYIGGVTGQNYGILENCTNSATICGTCTAVDAQVVFGGMAGQNHGTIRMCSNSGMIRMGPDSKQAKDFSSKNRANAIMGGIAGRNQAVIDSCSNSGTISGSTDPDMGFPDAEAGGIAGSSFQLVANCLNTGTIVHYAANSIIGGLVGFNDHIVQNCLSFGLPAGETYSRGGLLGRVGNYVQNCIYVTDPETSDALLYRIFGSHNGGCTIDDCITLKAGHPDLTSGHSAYRLGEAWGQNIDNGLPNEGHPVPGGARVYSRTDEIYSNTQHIIEIIAAKAPTCTEPGLTEGRQCTECGEVLVTQEEIPALGHDLQAAKTGKKLAKECSRCTYAEIIAAAAVTGKTVTVTLDGDIKPRFVWAASYDGQNRFVELVMKEVTGKTVTLTFGKDARGAVKVFFLDGSKTPCLEALAPK